MLGAVRSPVEETLGDSAAGLGVALRVVGDGEGGDGGAASGTRAPRHQGRARAVRYRARPRGRAGLIQDGRLNRSLDLALDVLGCVLHAVGDGEGAVEAGVGLDGHGRPRGRGAAARGGGRIAHDGEGPLVGQRVGRVLGDVDGLGFPGVEGYLARAGLHERLRGRDDVDGHARARRGALLVGDLDGQLPGLALGRLGVGGHRQGGAGGGGADALHLLICDRVGHARRVVAVRVADPLVHRDLGGVLAGGDVDAGRRDARRAIVGGFDQDGQGQRGHDARRVGGVRAVRDLHDDGGRTREVLQRGEGKRACVLDQCGAVPAEAGAGLGIAGQLNGAPGPGQNVVVERDFLGDAGRDLDRQGAGVQRWPGDLGSGHAHNSRRGQSVVVGHRINDGLRLRGQGNRQGLAGGADARIRAGERIVLDVAVGVLIVCQHVDRDGPGGCLHVGQGHLVVAGDGSKERCGGGDHDGAHALGAAASPVLDGVGDHVRALLLGRRKDDAPGALRHVDARGRGHGPLREGQGIAVGVNVVGQNGDRHLGARTHPHGVRHRDGRLVERRTRRDADADPTDGLLPQGVLDDVGEGIRSLDVVAGRVLEVRPHLGDGPEARRRGHADERHGVALGVDALQRNGDRDLVPGDGAGDNVLRARRGVRVLVHGDDGQVDDGRGDVTGRVGDRVDDAPRTGTGAAAHAHDVIRDEDAAQVGGDLVLEFAGDRELEPRGGAVVIQDRHGGHVPDAHDQGIVVQFGRRGFGVGGGGQDRHRRRGRGNPVGHRVGERCGV